MKEHISKLQIGPLSQAAPGPLYQQIVDAVRREISAGRLLPEAPLPSFRVLAESLLVSLITVKRAYEELEGQGIIYRRQGLGTFVAVQGGENSRETMRKNAEDLLKKAFREAREAGLSINEFIVLAEKTTNRMIRDDKGSKS